MTSALGCSPRRCGAGVLGVARRALLLHAATAAVGAALHGSSTSDSVALLRTERQAPRASSEPEPPSTDALLAQLMETGAVQILSELQDQLLPGKVPHRHHHHGHHKRHRSGEPHNRKGPRAALGKAAAKAASKRGTGRAGDPAAGARESRGSTPKHGGAQDGTAAAAGATKAASQAASPASTGGPRGDTEHLRAGPRAPSPSDATDPGVAEPGATTGGAGGSTSPPSGSGFEDNDLTWQGTDKFDDGSDSDDVDHTVDDWDDYDDDDPAMNASTTADDDYVGDEDAPMVNVTAEQDATASASEGILKASEPSMVAAPPELEVLNFGEGIGAMAYERSPSGSRSIDHDLRIRLYLQDYATVGLLVFVFFLTVALSCLSVYHVAEDPSPARYYSEPTRYQQRLICDTSDLEGFLAAFNSQPQNARLRIVGLNPDMVGSRWWSRSFHPQYIRPRGLAGFLPMRHRRRSPVLFDVALDLSPFITGDGRLTEENQVALQKYLSTQNALETVILTKKVDWVHWEDVATNIRQRLRALGFPGNVDVRFESSDEILVYQNKRWPNFVRNRVTHVLVALSVFGSVFWVPYVWLRSRTTRVETRFRINVDPRMYWELVSEGLHAVEGFQSL